MKKQNTPIRLSGRVFVHKLLAQELPRFALDNVRELQDGDVKLIAIPKGHGYTGFIRAYIWQSGKGGGWRNFALRKEAAEEAIYQGPVERESKALRVMMHLKNIAGSTATFGKKFYFVHTVAPKPVAAPAPQTADKPVVAAATTGSDNAVKTAATVGLVSTPAKPVAPVMMAPVKPGKRRRKAKPEDPNQGRLFD